MGSQHHDWKDVLMRIYTNEDIENQPFVLVKQTKWMRELTMNITSNSIWVIDCIFKTNQYDLSLYATMCHNIRMLGMPIFLMHCSENE
jgi:hypothetical protein